VLRARLALRRCARVPWSVRVLGRVSVTNHHRIDIGARVRFDGRTVPIELVSWSGPLTIGEGTYINYGCSISAHAGVSIGRNCLLGTYVLIMDNDYHDTRDHTKAGVSNPIVIDDEVWIGARAIVLKGVHVGRGAVIGAGAVVVKDVAPRTVVGGVPAAFIRKL